MLISFSDILAAKERIAPYIHSTPVMQSSLLNLWLGGHRVLFKMECMQTTGSFKLRGAMNVVKWLQERNQLAKEIIANSSGNHAQGVAYAAKSAGVSAHIYAASSISAIKAAATRAYGARLTTFDLRTDADRAIKEAAACPDKYWIPPYNHRQLIAGQGTLALEALEQISHEADAIFAPCGGGGLLSGSLVTARAQSRAQVMGVEPLIANDAAESLRQGKIIALDGPSRTLADGAATPSVGEITFAHLRQLDGFFEVTETAIAYWTQWLQHLLKVHIEPTSAMTMQGVCEWLHIQKSPKTVLVLVTGGNIDRAKMEALWDRDHLMTPPSLGVAAGLKHKAHQHT